MRLMASWRFGRKATRSCVVILSHRLRARRACTGPALTRCRLTARFSLGTFFVASRSTLSASPKPKTSSCCNTRVPFGQMALISSRDFLSQSCDATRSSRIGPGNTANMPLAEVFVAFTSSRRHQAAFFDELYFAGPEQLIPERRAACLSPYGVNLLLQRWVFHNTRVVVGTPDFQKVSGGPYEEADLTEEWVDERTGAGLDVRDAMVKLLHGYMNLLPTA